MGYAIIETSDNAQARHLKNIDIDPSIHCHAVDAQEVAVFDSPEAAKKILEDALDSDGMYCLSRGEIVGRLYYFIKWDEGADHDSILAA